MVRQRHIPLNMEVRSELDKLKRDYEDKTGDIGDWAKFLKTVSLAGMAALGIYSVSQTAKRGPIMWQVKCARCGVIFLIKVPNPPPWRLAQLACPKCGSELIIDFTKASSIAAQTKEGGTNSVYCNFCEQPIESISAKINPQGIEYVRCTHCSRIARISSWE